jgi:hypothetical protein
VVDDRLHLVAVDDLLEAQAPAVGGRVALDVRLGRFGCSASWSALRACVGAFLVGERDLRHVEHGAQHRAIHRRDSARSRLRS